MCIYIHRNAISNALSILASLHENHINFNGTKFLAVTFFMLTIKFFFGEVKIRIFIRKLFWNFRAHNLRNAVQLEFCFTHCVIFAIHVCG